MKKQVTSASYSNIVSINEIKTHINFSGVDTDTEKELIRMSNSAMELIEEYTELVLSARNMDIYFERDYDFDEDERTLILPVFPLNSISSLIAIDKLNVESALTANSTYYQRGLERKTIYLPGTFITGNQSEIIAWKLSGNFGYAANKAPSLCKEAILKTVAEWHNNKINYVPQLSDQVKMMLETLTDKTWL